MRIDATIWYHSLYHGQLSQVIEFQKFSDETTCSIWLLGGVTVVRFRAYRLKSIESTGIDLPDDIAYAAGARTH